ncbi:hypothetical protein KY362_01915, partial [Candidatus Woesearchaeota archaeon]|nr:hypothetical protein [Candidatus Woesearchaeota archaeon]
LWMAGKDIDITSEESQGCEGFVILKHMTGETGDAKDATEDFLGCGKLTEKGLLNFLPKTRRILAS